MTNLSITKNISLAALIVAAITYSSCGGNSAKSSPIPGDSVMVWVTTPDQKHLLNRQASLSKIMATDAAISLITIDEKQKYQEIEGFGASMTGSSAYVIQKHLSQDARSNLMRALFDQNQGIGISYMRMCIGASDFSSIGPYSYDDMPKGQKDYELKNFNIHMEKETLIPTLRQAFKIAPDMQLMGSPWSAPGWMKDSDKMEGGKLRKDAYPAFANYFVKYIKAFKEEGIPVSAITIQNEPQYESSYPSMAMTSQEQNDFIKNNLGPAFKKENIKSKIVLFDHNWDTPNYSIQILNDKETRKYVSGSGFHCYMGDVSAMSQVHTAHPDKGVYFTECSGGSWGPDFAGTLKEQVQTLLIGTTNNWSKNVLLWNLALDENNGPTTNKADTTRKENLGCMTCRGVVTINSKTGEITKNVEYYALGHFTKFVRPGAYRISSTQLKDQGLDNVAFINKNGTKVLVVYNNGNAPKAFAASNNQVKYSYTLQPGSVTTFVWK